jgi:AraC family transcriptional regulator, glycine betaine-responsive activator
MTLTAEISDLALNSHRPALSRRSVELVSSQPKQVVLLLLPNFSMVSLGSAIDPLRAANVLSEASLFQWELRSVDGAPVSAANGTKVAVDGRFEAPDSSTLVICCGGVSSERFLDHEAFRIMRAHVAMDGELIGTSDAAFVLARAGLLADGKCVIHWTCVDLFRELYPDIEVVSEMFHFSGNVSTASGGTAPLDLMVHYITRVAGQNLATQVSDYLVHERVRDGHEAQGTTSLARTGIKGDTVRRIVQLMKDNLEEPLEMEEIYERSGVSSRTLQRWFMAIFYMPPAKYYMDLRLRRGCGLLMGTEESIAQIAMACGFTSFSNFSWRFRKRFGITPRSFRKHGYFGRPS